MFRDLMRDKAKVMPTDPDAESVTGLRVWHCSYKTLAPIATYSSLRTLVVATYPDVDLAPLSSLTNLEYVSILHMPHVSDLTPLAALLRLRTLRLATLPAWDSSGRVTVVESLRPLSQLPRLQHLELFGVQPAGQSLKDLEDAPGLASVRVSKYPQQEVARFYQTTGVTDGYAPPPGVADWN